MRSVFSIACRCFLLALAAAGVSPMLRAQVAVPAGGLPTAETKHPFDKTQAAEVVHKLATTLEQDFVFPDKGKAYADRLRAQLAAGAYDRFADGQEFANKVTQDLQAVHKDGHLRLVAPARARSPGGESPAGEPVRMQRRPSDQSAVASTEWLAPGVAYIRFVGFPGNEATLSDLRKFIESYGSAKALIIDARMHRGGGLAEMDVLFPHLFAEPTTLVALDTRQSVDARGGNPLQNAALREVPAPAGIVRREHFVVPAAQRSGLADAKVFLLTSKRTASAGEHLALSLKRTGRATLIGAATRGAGHYGGFVPLGHGYRALVPVGRTFDPDTGEGWEGGGVKSDVQVAPEKALEEALKLAGVNSTEMPPTSRR